MADEEGFEARKPAVKSEEIREIVELSPQPLIRGVKVNKSGKNQLIRIPVEVTETLGIKVGDYFVFDITFPNEGKPELRFRIEKDDKKRTKV